jgi:hypothetical protein
MQTGGDLVSDEDQPDPALFEVGSDCLPESIGQALLEASAKSRCHQPEVRVGHAGDATPSATGGHVTLRHQSIT